MTRSEQILKRTEEILLGAHRVNLQHATAEQLHQALAQAVMMDIAPEWAASEANRLTGRQASYLSAEYLIGRQVFNNLYCAGVLPEVAALFEAKGAPVAALEDVEDAALGNGGLGRLAACFLDSAATRGIPLTGYGLRYRYGLFKQSFLDARQVEQPDDWTRAGDPWSLRREDLAVEVDIKGRRVRAVPYDMPVIGYGRAGIGTLRLWQTESFQPINFALFNDQRYGRASREKRRAEDITAFLYPNDSTDAGKLMRIMQQYVLSSASIQDMLRDYRARFGDDLRGFALQYAVQLNDTHPTMAILELIRHLTGSGIDFEHAQSIARETFSYTNHTVMREALEEWPVELLERAVPELVPIIRKVEERLTAESDAALSIMHGERVKMAELAVYMTHATNGVARIHSELIKAELFPAWYARYPERFQNVTNGVTQRRWLGVCNPELTALLTGALGGDGFLTDLNQLARLKPHINDALGEKFLAVKREKKRQLAAYIERFEGVALNPDWMFDVQVKRLHEYKRQLMNALATLAIYFELKEGRLANFAPTAVIFGAKAAPGYARAKAIIAFIHRIAERINSDPEVSDRLKVVFVANYNCSYAEKIIPAADVSEQISPAGTEASGTGNMKLMLNGALTLGTMDGATVEIVEQAGAENNRIFGADIAALRELGDAYDPRAIYEADPLLRRAVDALVDGTFDDPYPGEPGAEGTFAELRESLLNGASWHSPDHYYLFQDFKPYLMARLALNRAYRDPAAWARMALHNVLSAGKFSSDRSVEEYARNIWHVEPTI